MKKFFCVVLFCFFLQSYLSAQFQYIPQTGSIPAHIWFAHAVDDQIFWGCRRDFTGTCITTDGGNTWVLNQFTDPENMVLGDVYAFNADTAFAVGSRIFKTTNRGSTWKMDSLSFARGFVNCIHFFDVNNGIAFGDPLDGYFEIYTTTNGGDQWVRVPSSSIPAPLSGEIGLQSQHSAFNNTYWFITTSKRIFKSTDRGYTWAVFQIPGSWIPEIAFRDSLNGIASGSEIYRTTNGGSTWTMVNTYPEGTLWVRYPAHIPGTTTYTMSQWTVSGRDTLSIELFSKDDGISWKKMDARKDFSTGFLYWSSVNSGWNGMVDGGLFHWPGYTGKHIWRAPGFINYKAMDSDAADTLGINVGNYGTAALTINSLNLSSANFTLINPPSLPLTLQPWDAVDINIAFTPRSRGLLRDSLVVNSDAANINSMGITLTGKGLQYTPLSSGFIYAASDSFFNFTLSNLTAVPVGEFDGLIQGLTVRPADSVLFGISTDIHGSQLYKIDPVIGGCRKVVDLPVADMRAIAFAPSGTLFAGAKNGSLYKINTVTGAASPVGTASGKAYSSFAFSPIEGKLYASVSPPIGSSKDAIYTIDTISGAAALLGNTGDGKATPSIAFNADGKLYGLKGTQIVVNTLIEISTANGQGTELGSLGTSGLHAIIMSDNTTGINENTTEELSYALYQNYPNPFNPVTTINYSLKERNKVRFSIINILGEEISLLLNEEQDGGNHQVKFDGSGLSTGVYFYQLKAGEFKQTKKMLLVK